MSIAHRSERRRLPIAPAGHELRAAGMERAAGRPIVRMRHGARDPVCGMTVDRKTAFSSEWNGTTYYFCGPSCKARFEADPERYLQGGRAREHAHQH